MKTLLNNIQLPYTHNFFLNCPQNFGEIQSTIGIKLFYETLLMLIRGETVKYSKRKARNAREDEINATARVQAAREAFAESGNEQDADLLNEAQKQLEAIRKPKIQGLIIRSRVKWYDDGEKCFKYFLSLEKCNAKRKSVQMLHCDGEIITSKKEIISKFTTQLAGRYSSQQSHNRSGEEEFITNNI